MKNDKVAAITPVNIVLLTGTCVRLLTSEKNDGNNPSLAIAIRIRGWETQNKALLKLLGASRKYIHI